MEKEKTGMLDDFGFDGRGISKNILELKINWKRSELYLRTDNGYNSLHLKKKMVDFVSGEFELAEISV